MCESSLLPVSSNSPNFSPSIYGTLNNLRRYLVILQLQVGRCSSVSIVTGYGLDGPGIESRWGWEIFRTCPDRPWGPPSFLYNGYRVFPGGKERPGRDSDPSPPSSSVVMKEYSYTSTLPMGRTACTEPQCLYKGDLYLYLYRYLHSTVSCIMIYEHGNSRYAAY
jgi:hypothetical protein